MNEIFGASFARQFGDVGGEAFQTWSLAMQDVGVNEIKIGFEKLIARSSGYPPSLPEFKALCKPAAEDYGLPDVRSAYVEACKKSHQPFEHEWSHPGVYVAARETGFFELKSLSEAQMIKPFTLAYENVIRSILAGLAYDKPIPKALPQEVKMPKAKKETVTTNIAECMKALKRR